VLRRLALIVALALMVNGCASAYRWHKADATPETSARDEDSCRSEAHALSFEYAYGSATAPWNVSPLRRPYADPAWQAATEQRILERCMQGRGYQLERVDKAR